MKLAQQVLSGVYENKKDLKELLNIVKEMVKEGIPYNKNKEWTDFKEEALKRAKEEGLKVSGIDVMQALDKAIK